MGVPLESMMSSWEDYEERVNESLKCLGYKCRILNTKLGVGDVAETSTQTVFKLPYGLFLLLIMKCERQYIS